MAVNEIARLTLQRTLKPLLPAKWRFAPSQQSTDRLSTPVVKLQATNIVRPAGAGRGVVAIQFTASIYAPPSTTQTQEDAIDDEVLELIGAIERAGLSWGEALKTIDPNRANLAWEINNIQVTASLV
ncbi:hypothetical protein [Gryllotalpicola koreensis]|uniref:Uncharacterized protein n=1 Tax=Gryllotalpicola koreensis TaxID=993086 RepID=A0ABP7ZUI3_9MICO